jgi:protein involved in polysaccharide export with SLBB domain
MLLQSGDLVLFDEREILHPKVNVVGQVQKPGTLDLEGTTSLSALLTETGGPTPLAALNKAYILRKGQRLPVDLIPAAAGKTAGPGTDLMLEPDDILFVPENTEKFQVLGEAKQGGSFPYPITGKVTVMEAYVRAGGSTQAGDLAHAGIIRLSNGQYNVVPVNVAALINKKPNAVNQDLQPGDTLFIPAKKAKGGFDWGSVLSPLSALAVLGLRL